ncbi:hypothetical protein AC792_10915 [Arthrobacter sp. RIT-PI-e]|uniref:eCIS core domain-containing protein n=1 Tax=Arthrobacter sp. RIT-PI-e TaxID=1681197 RepID=UPI000676195F|nr:DUF4157 domain-containing protein [Arthrobacter sp. RIT-PI-e]KNC18657.1 hypothetical protein AC792_10915 [Arthrobacter sp. RIT-PI-e]
MHPRLVPLLNRINLSTPTGLALARVAGCTVSRGPHGILLAEGWSYRLPRARAFTVGNVVLLRGKAPAERSAAFLRLLDHEAGHTRQYAALGLPFLAAYALAAGWSVLLTGDPASRNPFERRAGLPDGGYVEKPLRPTLSALSRRVPGTRR